MSAAEAEAAELLLTAAWKGDSDAVASLLQARPGAALRASAIGRKPLHAAAQHGHIGVVAQLLGAAPEAAGAADFYGWTPLHLAVTCRRPAVVAQLLEALPAAATTPDRDGCTPLHLAVKYNLASMVRQLLVAVPSAALAADVDGLCPLHVAAALGHAAVVALLVLAAPEAAALRSRDGLLPLQMAEQAAPPARALSGGSVVARLLRAVGTARLTHELLEVLATQAASEPAAQLALIGLVACTPLAAADWQLVPADCAGLAAALAPVLERSPAEAALLVRRLPAGQRRRLHTAALCLARVQRRLELSVPEAILRRVLALGMCA